MKTPQKAREKFEANGCNTLKCKVNQAEGKALIKDMARDGLGPTKSRAKFKKFFKGKQSRNYND